MAITNCPKLKYEGNNRSLTNAILEANRILSDEVFYQKLEQINSFDNSVYSGRQIAAEFTAFPREITVTTFWRPWSRSNAGTLDKISVNTAKLNRSLASITNTLVHETVHAVDYLTNNQFDYTHHDNNPNGEANTAPWVIGELAELMVRDR
ncbi:hypothetical protein [Sediminibacterium soli]|uniref:hypothetical protein n=1 Tax=Sediminibacterium soli TaxID=2698829 RepID=UPI00137AECC7|nr:hypothetical protein [Sediminibacterium soli]NCI46510.1 hypothetical protein [Sediminibacterium soli]